MGRAREQGLLKIKPQPENRRFYTFANAKLGLTPELKKREVSRNFLSFGLLLHCRPKEAPSGRALAQVARQLLVRSDPQ